MRRVTFVLALGIAVVVTACGDGEPPASPADPDQPVQAPARTTEPGAPPPDPEVCERLAERLPGKALEGAEELAREKRCGLRVVSRDGVDLPVTEDYSATRINVRVADGMVTDVVGLF